MKYLNIYKNVKFSDHKVEKKKNRLRKWIKRIIFFLILLFLFLQFEHYNIAIEALEKVNMDELNTINDLSHKVHNLELSNANLQIQTDIMKIKLNGLELHNVTQQPVIHNVVSETANTLHTDSNIHNVTPAGIAATTAIAIFTVIKHIVTFSPVMP